MTITQFPAYIWDNCPSGKDYEMNTTSSKEKKKKRETKKGGLFAPPFFVVASDIAG